VLAHFSQDPALLHAFQHNIDRRRRTAARVLGIAESDVTDPQRQLGKTSNFGIAYGQTACVRRNRRRYEIENIRRSLALGMRSDALETFSRAEFRKPPSGVSAILLVSTSPYPRRRRKSTCTARFGE